MADNQEVNEAAGVARKALDIAMNHHFAGEWSAAEKHYAVVLQEDYRRADVLPLMAQVVAAGGETERALSYWQELLVHDPQHYVGLLEAGTILHGLKRFDEAIRLLEKASARVPGDRLALNNLAIACYDAGRHHQALEFFRQLAQLEPANPLREHQVRRVTSALVPFWHIPMLNDAPRNRAFEAAIRQAIAERGPHARILDIGSGSGLLSMMAARCGAIDITTCEVVPVIAETARRIIEANGFADRITIINKLSTELVMGEDLDGPADILISEILSSDLLAEHVLPTFEDAGKRLLKPDAIVIPRRVTAVGCLAESELLSRYCTVGDVSGFDVSAFNPLAPQRLPVHGTMTGWTRLSADVDLVGLDLAAAQHPAELRPLSVEVSQSGTAVGIIQWMQVDLAENCEFSNHPDAYMDGGWLQVLHPFPSPMPVTAGQRVELAVGHDRSSLIIVPLVRT